MTHAWRAVTDRSAFCKPFLPRSPRSPKNETSVDAAVGVLSTWDRYRIAKIYGFLYLLAESRPVLACKLFALSADSDFAMPTLTNLLTFALVALGMVLTPGPNMIYLISRSICQGRNAGLVSLAGIATGFVFYMLCAAFGITALLMAVPFAYDALRFGGAIYLLYLAWQAVRPGGRAPFQVRELPVDSPRKL